MVIRSESSSGPIGLAPQHSPQSSLTPIHNRLQLGNAMKLTTCSYSNFLRLLTVLTSTITLSFSDKVEKYVYIIYHDENTDCTANTVSIHGKVSNEEWKVQGAYPFVNETLNQPEFHKCGYQTSCMINIEHDFCKAVNQSITGTAEFEINEFGRIVECDATNLEKGLPECIIREGCTISSSNPACKASDLYIRPTLLREPEFLENKDGVGLGDWSSYMVFYSDDKCNRFEGVHGILSGKHDLTIADVSCEEALACLYHQDGEKCQSYDESLKSMETFFTKNDDFKSFDCTDETGENCVEREDVCAPSPIPQCYYRWVSARKLFANPAEYVKDIPPAGDVDKNVVTQCDGDCTGETSDAALLNKAGGWFWSVTIAMMLAVASTN